MGSALKQPDTASPFVRAFAAVPIPEAVRTTLAAVQQRLRATRAHVGWVPPPNIHLSLAFLGSVERSALPLLALALDTAAGACVSFAVRVAELGTFGSTRSPRVIWAGVEPADALHALQRRVAAAIEECGVALEPRPYRPHLTLGRVRSPRGRQALVAALAAEPPLDAGVLPVNRVRLMQSVLSSAGARYSVLHETALRTQGGRA